MEKAMINLMVHRLQQAPRCSLEAHAPAMPCASGSGLDRVPVPGSSDRQA
jgi:hypothetical protein